ncbi:hypothetical protein Y032_0009g447 [Ancylostoma ceylanicum]|uniref:Uncharacterized protein n=1 Tax=Ancylostoma ceylanicum TaxID=53326 RepID=A0A016VH47_9BILA|nr:hypothetical protein Y032_0009g447 [Ancylostoma ceylanicum]
MENVIFDFYSGLFDSHVHLHPCISVRMYMSSRRFSLPRSDMPSSRLGKKNANQRKNTILTLNSIGTRKHPILLECGNSVKYKRAITLPVEVLEDQFGDADKGGVRRYHGVR